MLEIIFQNFFTFDFIIFLLAIVNAVILVQTIRFSRKLYDALNPYCWIPGGEASLAEIKGKFARRNKLDSESDIIRLRRRMNAFYVVYENLTAIFPLLGLLGTVVSLIPLVNNMGEVATGLFFSALTSTMWGIIFAIIFKVANGYVASGIEDNEKNIDIYLQRNTDKLLRERALAESAEGEAPDVVAEAEENSVPATVVPQPAATGDDADFSDTVADSAETATPTADDENAEAATAEALSEVATDPLVEATTGEAVSEATTADPLVEATTAGALDNTANSDPFDFEPVHNKKTDPALLAPEFFGTTDVNKENADEKA